MRVSRHCTPTHVWREEANKLEFANTVHQRCACIQLEQWVSGQPLMTLFYLRGVA